MKVLTLSRNKLEIAKTQLVKPLLIIGRSPTCDVVLRAPGIKPVHFIVEWLGSGVFDPTTGTWSIVDVSHDSMDAEGLVLSGESLNLAGISFKLIESRLESTAIIGGNIIDSLRPQKSATPDLLEFVQVRTDSGAIEEVNHVSLDTQGRSQIAHMSKEFRAFRVELPKMKADHVINVLLDEMPGAELLLSGRKIDTKKSLVLKPQDFLQVKWSGRDFYLRFVEEVKAPPIPRDFWGSPLLRKLSIVGALLMLLLLFRAFLWTPEEEKPEELPRVARVEIPATPAPPPPPPPPPVSQEQPKEPAKEAKANVSTEPALEIKTAAKKAPAKAVAPKQASAPTAPPKAGLNNAAKVSDVNQVGLLGALSKNVKKGPGVQADQIINSGIISQNVTAKDNSAIVIKQPPSGVLGSGKSGSPTGSTNAPTLGAASTTLSGVSKGDPNSTGLIARKGSESGFSLGSGTTGSDKVGGGKAGAIGIGGTEGGDFSVAGGGLDRETVKRIIRSYQNQILNCYERGLIANPSLAGRVVYKWQISPQGNVVTSQIVKATVESPNLKSCVLSVIQSMAFPKAANGLPTTVIYPFVFQGKR